MSNKVRYFARSASDKTDDWPFWFVADKQQGGLNVTNNLLKDAYPETNFKGKVLLTRTEAIELAKIANSHD